VKIVSDHGIAPFDTDLRKEEIFTFTKKNAFAAFGQPEQGFV
jgi:hypothetical protein